MTTKVCFICEAEKPVTEFYQHDRMADGRLNKCKECTKEYSRNHRKENPEYYLEYDRKRANAPHRVEARKLYAQTPAGKAASKRSAAKHLIKYPIKRGARIIVGNALRDGKLTRPECCEDCGKQRRLHGHHDDYARPLDVRWLCPTCHATWHKENGEGLNG